MRVAIYLLAFANLVLFVLAGGLNGGASRPSHAPVNELSPERIAIVSRGEPPPAKAPPMPKPEVQACLSWPDLAVPQGDRIAQLVEGGGVLLTRETTVAETKRWSVRIPPAGGKVGAEKKAAELRRLGVKRFTIVEAEGDLQYAIAFGRFDREDDAQKALDGLRQKTVRSAVLVEEGDGDGRERVLARGPAERIEALRDAIEGVTPQACEAAAVPAGNGTR